MRMVTSAMSLFRTTAYFFALSLLYAHADATDGRLDIYWIDVEGGAATLIVTPAGESVLIDTGLPKVRQVQRIADTIKRVAKLDHLDHLIISHYDIDHHGGAAGLAKLVPVKTLYDNGKDFAGRVNDPGEAYWKLECDKRVVVNPGDKIPLAQRDRSGSPAVVLDCIATRREFIEPPGDAPTNSELCAGAKRKDEDRSENRNSMVFILAVGGFRFYNATDLTWNLEEKLVCPVDLVGPVDVCQVTHHGLDRSNNPLVWRTIKPTVAVMNNGATKGCATEVVENLRATPSIKAIFQLHKHQRPSGAANNTEPKRIANTEKGKAGNLVKLSVSPAGDSYTVRIPATGHEETFETRAK